MDYKYRELDYAKIIYENGFQSEQHRPTELRLVATYMRRILNYPSKKLREGLYQWCEAHIPGYQKELYYKIINTAIHKACKKGSALINIESVDFYQYELDYIMGLWITDSTESQKESIYAYQCKKLLFTFLFQMKVNQLIAEAKSQEDTFVYEGKYFQGGQKKYSALKKLAKLPEKVKIHEDLIHTLWMNGLVSPMFNGLIKLSFMEELYQRKSNAGRLDSVIVLQVKDYDAVGWYFDYYNQDRKISFCKECGKLFKKSANRQEYCSDQCFTNNRRKYKAEKQKEYRTHNPVDSSKQGKALES